MATHSTILAWKISMGKGAWRGYSQWGHKELDTTEQLSLSVETEPYAAAAVDLQHPLREFRVE